MKSAVDRYRDIAAQPRFAGWPLVGEHRLGAIIPYFGQVLEYNLQTPKGVEPYVSLLRHFGWCVVFGVTTDSNVVTLVQWKPGVNCASWELPPGGIGKVGADITAEELLARTQAAYRKETGYSGGSWTKLGYVIIESGKIRGASPKGHGLLAHLFLATDLVQDSAARQPDANEIIETLHVPLSDFWSVIDSGLFVEASAVPCALLALRKLGIR